MLDNSITALEPFIQRTPLTEKLLSKPPFRYLHDLISEFITNTGFGAGLFMGPETISTNMKEKEQKIAWLTKIIKLTEMASGSPIKAKPAKIIAGLEPEETNAWLQVLAKCAKIDTSEMVTSLGGTPPPPKNNSNLNKENIEPKSDPVPTSSSPLVSTNVTTKNPPNSNETKSDLEPGPISSQTKRPSTSSNNASSKSPSSSSNKSSSSMTKDKEKSSSSSSTTKRTDGNFGSSSKLTSTSGSSSSTKTSTTTNTSVKRSSTSKSSSSKDKEKGKEKEKSKSRDKLTDKGLNRSHSDKLDITTSDKPATQEMITLGSNNPTDTSAPSIPPPIPGDETPLITMVATNNPPTIISPSTEDEPTDTVEATLDNGIAESVGDLVVPNGTSIRRERPTTARKAPPRARPIDDKVNTTIISGDTKGNIGGSIGGNNNTNNSTNGVMEVNVVPDNTGLITLTPNLMTTTEKDDNTDSMFIMVGDDHRDPMSLPKDNHPPTNSIDLDPSAPHGGLVRKLLESKRSLSTELSPSEGEGGGKNKNNSNSSTNNTEVQLQLRVQAVTRTAHPLGRTLDYMHEDIDAMSKEQQHWRSEIDKYRNLLIKEREITESKVRPLLDEMAKLDAAIVLEQEKIAQAKARVIANEERVDRYVAGMVSLGI